MSIHRRLGAVLGGAGLALLLAAPTLAHADLEAATPPDGAVLEVPPTSIELTFTEGLVAGKSSLRLVGPDGEVGTARPARDGARVIRLEGLSLGPGDYRIKWTAGADDGHVERGQLTFTVTAAPTAAPTDPSVTEAPATPSEPSPTPAPTVAPTAEATAVPAPSTPIPSPSPTDDDAAPAAGSGSDVLLPIVAGLVLVGLVGLFVLRRGRTA